MKLLFKSWSGDLPSLQTERSQPEKKRHEEIDKNKEM
jgi:hypothetical protein